MRRLLILLLLLVGCTDKGTCGDGICQLGELSYCQEDCSDIDKDISIEGFSMNPDPSSHDDGDSILMTAHIKGKDLDNGDTFRIRFRCYDSEFLVSECESNVIYSKDGFVGNDCKLNGVPGSGIFRIDLAADIPDKILESDDDNNHYSETVDFGVAALCTDACGDGACARLDCTGGICPCKEDNINCPEDCGTCNRAGELKTVGCCIGLSTWDTDEGQMCYDSMAGTPECRAIGSAHEGFYYSDTSMLIRKTDCDRTECEESDNGNDRFNKGTTTTGSIQITDTCLNDYNLQEYYCNGATYGSTQIICRCSEGRCMTEGTDLSEYPEIFIDSNRFNAIIVTGENAPREDFYIAKALGDSLSGLTLKCSTECTSYSCSEVCETGTIPESSYRHDTEITDPSAMNIISIGSICNNQASAKLLGSPENCNQVMEDGIVTIRLLKNNDYHQLLIYGQTENDLTQAIRYLQDYDFNPLQGDEIKINTRIQVDCTDTDKSTDYDSLQSIYPITRDRYPDLYTKSMGQGDYYGTGDSMLIDTGQMQKTNAPMTTYYDHCHDENQLNEAYCHDEVLHSISIICTCRDGRCIT